MTVADIINAIKAHSLTALADEGSDDAVAAGINAAMPAPVPITVQMLAGVAPTTLGKIAAMPDSLANLETIGSRIRVADWQGVGSWADTLLLAGIMPQTEHDKVTPLVTAATPAPLVTHTDVSAALAPYRAAKDANGVPRAVALTWTSMP